MAGSIDEKQQDYPDVNKNIFGARSEAFNIAANVSFLAVILYTLHKLSNR